MKKIFYLLCFSVVITACIPTGTEPTIKQNDLSLNLTKIAITSCCYQTGNLSIYRAIQAQNPQLCIAMGDNVYADNIISNPDYPAWIQSQYDLLKNNYDYKNFRAAVPTIATWDDHDYGLNNAGKEFPYKLQSKDKFMQFWQIPSTHDIRTHDGVYTSYMYGDASHRVQIIMLDCRSFLDVISPEPITPTTDPTKTILGATQWAWLKTELEKPATVRIVVSSSQMCIEKNGWEGWPNYPLEQQKFFQTVKDANAEGVFVVSGDVHYSEFSKRSPAGQYPIYDFTSSGLTHTEAAAAPNAYRIGNAYRALSFGIINIDWNTTPVTIKLDIRDNAGNVAQQQVISLDELKF